MGLLLGKRLGVENNVHLFTARIIVLLPEMWM
jgi:hypothetical protein